MASQCSETLLRREATRGLPYETVSGRIWPTAFQGVRPNGGESQPACHHHPGGHTIDKNGAAKILFTVDGGTAPTKICNADQVLRGFVTRYSNS